jgi:hypothetical protein
MNFKFVIYTFAFLYLLTILSCKKKEEQTTPSQTTPEITITSEDVADLVAVSISTSSEGLNSNTAEIAAKISFVNNQLSPCGYNLDTSISRSTPIGSAISFTYNLNYSYQMYCNGFIPDNMLVEMTANGDLEQVRLTATSQSTGNLTFTGLTPNFTSYLLNGTYSRTGSATSKVREKNTFSYSLTLNLSDLSVSKTDYYIDSGSCTLTFAATISSGKVFNFTGTLTYVDENTANLVIGGTTYSINIPSSLVN